MRFGRHLTLLAPLVSGCLSYESEGDAKIPGHELGTFEVSASLAESSCGAGALGSEDVWEFPVRLSRDTDELFWLNGREVIRGQIGADGRTFSFDTGIELEVSEAHGAQPGCTLTRNDRASGQLETTGTDVGSFSGTLEYRFAATEESDCSELAAVPDGLSTLPCEISYVMKATRVAAPEE